MWSGQEQQRRRWRRLIDPPLAKGSFEKVSHLCWFSVADMGDLVEGFQWITSDEKLL